jgi:hypothetical protein
LPESAAMAVVVGPGGLRAGGRHGGRREWEVGEASRGWHGSDGGGRGGQHGREGSRSRSRWVGWWARVAVFSAVCVCVCDEGESGGGREGERSDVCLVGFPPPASALVYVAGPSAPGHLPVCVAYGHLSLSTTNNYLHCFVQVPVRLTCPFF